MRSFAILVASSMLLGGCIGQHELAVLSAQQRQIVCIDGVEYIAVPVKDSWSVAPHYKPDGTLFTCSDSVPPNRRPIAISPR